MAGFMWGFTLGVVPFAVFSIMAFFSYTSKYAPIGAMLTFGVSQYFL
ncbi:MAG: hypothetical protein GF329_20170 [Candidatus Lokiarchaeota archaeon]|nr:hypothetical protein [Candidatus Lokiarchaeota archaeon]